jgi:hypothetical protein
MVERRINGWMHGPFDEPWMPRQKCMYRQVKLQSKNSITTSWIPSQFAVVGKVLRLGDDPAWWKVISAPEGLELDQDEVNVLSEEYKHWGP